MTAADFRDFTFANVVRLFGRQNPRLFDAVLPPIRLPSSDALLVYKVQSTKYKVTAALPNEMAGNDGDCLILAP